MTCHERYAWPKGFKGPKDPVGVIGDIHGHITPMEAAVRLAQSEAGSLILTGDYVDRGPESLACLTLAHELHITGKAVALVGNHEQMAWNALGNPVTSIRDSWEDSLVVNGGQRFMHEIAGAFDTFERGAAAVSRMITALDHDHAINTGETTLLFIHAGIPTKDRDQPLTIYGQRRPASADLVRATAPRMFNEQNSPLWVRKPFLTAPRIDASIFTLHGHTQPHQDPFGIIEQIGSHRLNVDGGAASGMTIRIAVLHEDAIDLHRISIPETIV